MRIARTTALFPILLSSVAVAQTASPATPAAAAPTAPSAQPPRCVAAEHRQFDFWVGNWDVYQTGTDRRVGRNLIESLYNGCAIRENWAPLGGGSGGSLNSWLPGERKWRQTWVDSSNSYAVFEGGMDGEAMVLTGTWPGAAGPGTTPLIRMRYTREAGGAVRQLGEQSTDQGTTWAPSFDLTYRPSRTASD